jgi:hypothetical protein
MSRHLGPNIAPLLDGQLSQAATTLAWRHVAECEICSDEVARQTWVKGELRKLNTSISAPE